MKMAVFGNVELCSLVDTDRCFRGAYCLHHQGKMMMEAVNSPETSVSIYQLHGVTYQKTVLPVTSLADDIKFMSPGQIHVTRATFQSFVSV
jgi:hypothetical protein